MGFDGEVIAVDETGRPQFYELLRVPRSASYVAFDILWLHDYGFVDVEHGRHLVHPAPRSGSGHCRCAR